MRRQWMNPRVSVPIITLTIALSTLGIRSTGLLQRLELYAYDEQLTLIRGGDNADERIVLVGITEADLQEHGAPIPDAAIAQALRILTQYEAAAVGLDVFRDMPVGEGFDELREALRANPRIVGARSFPQNKVDRGRPCPEPLRDTDRCGFADLKLDPDGIIRRALLYMSLEDEPSRISLALAVVLAAGVRERPDPRDENLVWLDPDDAYVRPLPDGWEKGARGGTIPRFRSPGGGYARVDDRGYQTLLDFKRDPLGLRPFSLTQLLDGHVGRAVIENKVVLIGYMAPSAADIVFVPIQDATSRLIFGVELHAHAISQLLRIAYGESGPVHTLSETSEALWILFCTAIGALLGLTFRLHLKTWILIGSAAGIALAIWGAAIAALAFEWWLPTVPSLGASLLCTGVVALSGSARERFLRSHLDGILGSDLIAAAMRNPDDFLDKTGWIKTKSVVVTSFFADMRGYTAAARKMDGPELLAWIQEFMSRMTHIILDHGGMLDDYAGDGIKADFGVPVGTRSVEEYAVAAVDAALEMIPECSRLLADYDIDARVIAEGMRIGIFTGDAAAGAIGTRKRFKYTVVGTSVNTAARLESFSQVPHDFEKHPCRILIGEPTRALLDDKFEIKGLGAYEMKGLEKMEIYQVIRRRRPREAAQEAK